MSHFHLNSHVHWMRRSPVDMLASRSGPAVSQPDRAANCSIQGSSNSSQPPAASSSMTKQIRLSFHRHRPQDLTKRRARAIRHKYSGLSFAARQFNFKRHILLTKPYTQHHVDPTARARRLRATSDNSRVLSRQVCSRNGSFHKQGDTNMDPKIL